MAAAVNDKNAILLPPGDVCFNHAPKKIKTILGSCVAVTVWHRKKKLGGLCHFLISSNTSKHSSTNYRHGDAALNYLLHNMAQHAPIHEFDLRLFGGANMYPSKTTPTVGESNIRYAKNWASKNKLTFSQQEVLGNICRSIIFDLSTGTVQLQQYQQEQGIHHDN